MLKFTEKFLYEMACFLFILGALLGVTSIIIEFLFAFEVLK